MPALSAGLRQNMQSPEGLSGLVSALSGGTHQRYINDPAVLADAGTVADGNGILGHVLGSKEVSRQVATRAGAQTGIGPDVLKRMLPLVATTWQKDIVADIQVTGSPAGAAPAVPAPAPAPARTYTVKAGDTLSAIAKEHLGSRATVGKCPSHACRRVVGRL